jgi:fatty acid desaturase
MDILTRLTWKTLRSLPGKCGNAARRSMPVTRPRFLQSRQKKLPAVPPVLALSLAVLLALPLQLLLPQVVLLTLPLVLPVVLPAVRLALLPVALKAPLAGLLAVPAAAVEKWTPSW